MPCRTTGKAPSSGQEAKAGKTWATAFIVLLVGRAGQGGTNWEIRTDIHTLLSFLGG